MILHQLLLWVLFLGLSWALAAPAAAQSLPPQEPILRIDPGMHTASVRRIGVDTACSLLATASEDKTVRLWRVPTATTNDVAEQKLQPLRTLRPPIGAGNDGLLFAVAVAPDGGWVATGGWDPAMSSSGEAFIYLFESSTGAVIARLGPLSATILHLAVSPDGRYLAATLFGGEGVRIWEKITTGGASSWRLRAEDKDYGGVDAYGAAFDRAGVLYTVALDGKLRRYDQQSKTTWVLTHGGKKPYSVAAHPEGDRVAVAYEDTPAVEVYDAATLSLRFSADVTGVRNDNLHAVTWSRNGELLYASGPLQNEGVSTIRIWDRGGQGPAREVSGGANTVHHLLACGDGIAFGTHEPAFGLLAPDGRRRAWQGSVQADLRGQYGEQGFSAATDGRRVHFGLDVVLKSLVLFDLATEQLTDAPTRPPALVGADTASLPVTDWAHNPNPKLAGVPIKLMPNEVSRSLAIAPDKQRFVLGAEWTLRAYDKDGTSLWHKVVSHVIWGVTITQDGKLIVAAYGDGTIRWHRLHDGEELLTLFVNKLDRRWVAWTPKGYYMASPGAESLIGWHVNRGWNEAAQFFPVDRFRDQFNRPDIVKLVLETLDEGKAIQMAHQATAVARGVDVRTIAPPIVVIQTPGDATPFRTPEVTIEYDVFSPTGQKITNVDFLINNAALGARFAAPPTTGRFTASGRVTLPLPPEDVTVTLIAREGTRASEPASIRLRWDGAKPGQVALPRLRGLFVGVNEYVSPKLTKLGFAAKDATDLAALFASQEGKTYSKVEMRVLPNAKRIDVLNGLDWLEKGSEEGDINVLFLAGHGATIDQHFYYMAADSDPEMSRATAVSRDEILRTISKRKGAMVVMLDACHSGASTDAPPAGASRVDMNRLANELGDRSLGVLLYASARGRQFSYERAEWGNGAFTRAMLDGLAGAADREKLGFVDTEELSIYVRRRVMAMTKGLQEPVRVKPDAAPEMRIVLLK